MRAYDIDLLHRPPERGGPDDHGWCFGLPPGIAPHEWPLDPNNGYPLMHGFTLLLPEDYRCHGPDVVALSFFAIAVDHNDGGPTETEGLRGAIAAPGAGPPEDSAVRPFWKASRRPHPRLHRMQDILDCDYAVILLTRVEFEGPLCLPPPLVDSPLLAEAPEPRWLEEGGAAVFWDSDGCLPHEGCAAPWLFAALGGQPNRDPLYSRALRLRPRPHDPNAGRIPRSKWRQQDSQSDYRHPEYRDNPDFHQGLIFKEEWANSLARNHLGGTMRPSQDVPAFSPYYIEFEEYLGGYNFGGGNAQLDFKDMKFDWACG